MALDLIRTDAGGWRLKGVGEFLWESIHFVVDHRTKVSGEKSIWSIPFTVLSFPFCLSGNGNGGEMVKYTGAC